MKSKKNLAKEVSVLLREAEDKVELGWPENGLQEK